MHLKRRATVVRAGLCRHTARCGLALDPADCGRSAETEHSRRFPSALVAFDERERSRPEVVRVSLCHRATSPLLSKQLESALRASENPLLFRFTSAENRSNDAILRIHPSVFGPIASKAIMFVDVHFLHTIKLHR